MTGWSNGSSTYTSDMTSANVNPSNALAIAMTAQWRQNCASGVTSETINLAVNASKTLSYTGAAKCLIFSKDGNYKFELWGAQGNYYSFGDNSAKRGYGSYVSGNINIKTTNALYLYIGQHTHDSNYYQPVFNNSSTAKQNNNTHMSSSGGGATDIRTVFGVWNNADSLRSRIMVAAAGGGNYYQSATNRGVRNDGGGLYSDQQNAGSGNNDASISTCIQNSNGIGGTQISGGIAPATDSVNTNQTSGGFGYGGNGPDAGTSPIGGGGGSGWYGGAGGKHFPGYCVISGGGGSSYISGHTGSVAVTSTSSSSPKSGCTTGTNNNACSITPYINPATGSGYTFTNTLMIDGAGYKWTNTKGSLQAMPNPSGGNYASGVGHSGNGYARITYLGT